MKLIYYYEFPGKGRKKIWFGQTYGKLYNKGTIKHQHGNGRVRTVCNEWCNRLKVCMLEKGG